MSDASPGRRILFVVNSAEFFRSHRQRLAEVAMARGFRVLVACGAGSGEERLGDAGIPWIALPLSRSGFNPWAEWRAYRALCRLYRIERPDLVHHVTLKPVIYGTRAARLTGVPGVVNAVAGLGFVFTARGMAARARRALVAALLRFALVHPRMRFILQNHDDLDDFVALTRVPRDSIRLIAGSGVDLNVFVPRPEPAGPATFVLVSRMLKDKGVREFVAAARHVAATHADWRFRLVGGPDPGNPTSLSEAELAAWHAEGVVEWLGHRDDVSAILADCHVVCLPSYREGMPKSLLEAAAAGRAAIAADVPGCRDAVRDGVTGLLVPARSAAALAQAMLKLGEDDALRRRMAAAARTEAEARHGIEHVIRATFEIYEELLAT